MGMFSDKLGHIIQCCSGHKTSTISKCYNSATKHLNISHISESCKSYLRKRKRQRLRAAIIERNRIMAEQEQKVAFHRHEEEEHTHAFATFMAIMMLMASSSNNTAWSMHDVDNKNTKDMRIHIPGSMPKPPTLI